MNQIHEAINDALDKTQKTYDEQTNHSINVEAQKYWEAYIAEELQKLEKFKKNIRRNRKLQNIIRRFVPKRKIVFCFGVSLYLNDFNECISIKVSKN